LRQLKLAQGSPEWHDHRLTARNASEAPGMMGDQTYGMSRAQLLEYKATGLQENISDFLQAKFAEGHRTEALARPIAESIIGEELFPVVGESDDGYLSASFDGITMSGIGFEHKLYSDKLASMIDSGELSGQYVWQLEQQCIVGGLSKILFVASDGTQDNFKWLWYYPSQERTEKLLGGWKQFDKDLAEWVSKERNDQDWMEVAELYRVAKLELDRAQEKLDTIKSELIELAPLGGKGFGVNLARVEKAGAVKWSEVAKALKPPPDLIAKYTGKSSVSYTVTIAKEQ